jgi:hypothetical protein
MWMVDRAYGYLKSTLAKIALFNIVTKMLFAIQINSQNAYQTHSQGKARQDEANGSSKNVSTCLFVEYSSRISLSGDPLGFGFPLSRSPDRIFGWFPVYVEQEECVAEDKH